MTERGNVYITNNYQMNLNLIKFTNFIIACCLNIRVHLQHKMEFRIYTTEIQKRVFRNFYFISNPLM